MEDSDSKTGDSGKVPINTDKAMLASGERVFLQSAQVRLQRKGEKENVQVTALLDCACTRSYITEELASKLRLKMREGDTVTVSHFGTNKTLDVPTREATVELLLADKEVIQLAVSVVPTISGSFMRGSINLSRDSPKIRGLHLADKWPASAKSSKIDLLIGNDYYLEIVTGERILLQEGLNLLGSRLGWILSGRTKTDGNLTTDKDHAMLVLNQTNSFVLEPTGHADFYATHPGAKPNPESLWDLDTIRIKDVSDSTEDDVAQSAFDSSVKYEDGRYQVCWPWKSHFKDLPQNYQLSLGRLKSTVRKLEESPDLIEKYNDIIEDQLKKGVIESVSSKEDTYDTLKHYIPDFPIVNLQRTTTKVRIVYDASAKTRKDGPSLNDFLYRGSTFMENLCGLLMRFPMPNIVLLSDIEKAFLQVGLQLPQRDVTRFLWIKDLKAKPERNNLQTYRFCRVPFGMVSSPFLLRATVDHHLKITASELANSIRSNIYMDNVVLGTSTLQEANELYKEAKCIFDKAGMNLRGWVSNSQEFIDGLPEKYKGNTGKIKVLGLHFDTSTDEITVKFDPVQEVSTKRQVLHTVARIFDPLGLFLPFTLGARMFLQELWRKELDWDDPISMEDKAKWVEITALLNQIPKIGFPRQVVPLTQEDAKFQLHCFCDASLQGYCAVVYLRLRHGDDIRTNIVFAKSRVAPKRPLLSIPRLELMSALIGIRSLQFVAKKLRIKVERKVLWSDSQCVLHWIESGSHPQVFVQNRLKEITKEKYVKFRYVNTMDNPADYATRSTTFQETLSMLWLSGPTWLKSEDKDWPKWIRKQRPDHNKKQAEIVAMTNSASLIKDNFPLGINIGQYSSLTRLTRVTAWCFRFMRNVKDQTRLSGPLQSHEIQEGLKIWIRSAQNHGSENATGGFCVCKDKDGIYCCITPLKNAEIAESAKKPIWLPKNYLLTKLIIRDLHQRLGHAGVSHTLSQLKQRYLVPQGRRTVKKWIQGCLVCKFWEGGPYRTPEFPQLPKSRVRAAPPFTYVGLDYFGPLYVKNEGKVWACIFTCLTVRAVHLELIRDMSTHQFLMALRRFIARRGRPKQIISDNATQFKLAKSVVDTAWNEMLNSGQCQDFASNDGITWSFILELAPWQGGFMKD